MNIRNFFFSHQAEAVQETVQPIIVREDFIIDNSDDMTIRTILHTLRERTITFVENNNLNWGATDFEVRGIPTRVKLTENYDVIYIIDGDNFFDLKMAIEAIHSLVQF